MHLFDQRTLGGLILILLAFLVANLGNTDHESVRPTPLQLTVAAVVLAALFIFTLVTIVRIVVA